MEFFEQFLNSDFYPMILRACEFLFMSILFVKGEISMSKYAQYFSNMELRFTSSKDDRAVPEAEQTDLQEEMNSHKDECLSSFLDKYLDFANESLPFAVDTLADGEFDMLNTLVGTNADKVLKAYDNLMDIRERYDIPDKYSNEELVAYLREMSTGKEVKADEKTQTVAQSEPQKLSQNDTKDA